MNMSYLSLTVKMVYSMPMDDIDNGMHDMAMDAENPDKSDNDTKNRILLQKKIKFKDSHSVDQLMIQIYFEFGGCFVQEECTLVRDTGHKLTFLMKWQSLRDQGVQESEDLLLLRSDLSNRRDTTILYELSRDTILDGLLPVTQEEAIQLAGIQAHIQFGDYNENKHKSRSLESKGFLPKEYSKTWNKRKMELESSKKCSHQI